MTNQLQFLEKADNIILLGEGEIIAQGKYEELKERGIDFSEFILKSGDDSDGKSDDTNSEGSEDAGGEDSKITKTKTLKSKKETIKKKEGAGVNSAKELEGSESSAGTQIMTEEEQSTSCFSLLFIELFIFCF
jgi:ABC-type multidrug transport system ATPase subunit